MFVVVFTDYVDVTEVVGTFESHAAGREWAIENRPDAAFSVMPVTPVTEAS